MHDITGYARSTSLARRGERAGALQRLWVAWRLRQYRLIDVKVRRARARASTTWEVRRERRA